MNSCSSVKAQYRAAYQICRYPLVSLDDAVSEYGVSQEVVEAAERSNGNKHRRFTGWINPVRHGHFKNRILVYRNGGELPF